MNLEDETQKLFQLKVVSLYVNFPWKKLLHRILVFVTRKPIGKVSLRKKIVKRAHTIPLYIVYLKHEPRKSNANIFVNPKVVSWYVTFRGT